MNSLQSFAERYQALKAHQDNQDHLLHDLMTYTQNMEARLLDKVGELETKLHEAELDLEDSRHSRRALQQQLNTSKGELASLTLQADTMKNRNPYIAVLIDGDGLIFNPDLVQAGQEGGKKAANMLRNAVIEQYPDLPGEAEVLVKCYANLTGLGKAMIRDRCLDDIEDLRNFAVGFTQAKAGFDFIDVGFGKERADSKIRETTRFHLRNHNCKHILLGISHDAGYAPFLDNEVSRDAETFRRVAILEGSPLPRDLSQTGVEVLTFENIFRSDKLESPHGNNPSAKPIISNYHNSNYSNGYANGNGNHGDANGRRESDPRLSPHPSSQSWATLTSNNGVTSPPAMTFPITPKPLTNAKPEPMISTTPDNLDWHPGPRGLDKQISVPQSVLNRTKNRPQKLCNKFYLTGQCMKGDDCPFDHDSKPTEAEMDAIRYLTRLNPCTLGQGCENNHCIYGHHCPTSVGIPRNCNAYCRFPEELHPPGTAIRNPRK